MFAIFCFLANFLRQPQAGQELVRPWGPRYPAPRLPSPHDRETCWSQDSHHHQQEEYNAQYLFWCVIFLAVGTSV
jgi:hypothetical protein